MLQKLWQSQNEVKLMKSINSEIIEEIEQMKSTLGSQSPIIVKRKKGKNRSKSRSKSRDSQERNPFMTHLDQMKNNYKQKMLTISKMSSFSPQKKSQNQDGQALQSEDLAKDLSSSQKNENRLIRVEEIDQSFQTFKNI